MGGAVRSGRITLSLAGGFYTDPCLNPGLQPPGFQMILPLESAGGLPFVFALLPLGGWPDHRSHGCPGTHAGGQLVCASHVRDPGPEITVDALVQGLPFAWLLGTDPSGHTESRSDQEPPE